MSVGRYIAELGTIHEQGELVLIDKWAINESLLQSYRSTFISSQSFLLAVGTIVWDKNSLLLYLIGSIGLGMIWFIWFPVVRARHRIVDYYKGLANLSSNVVPCTEEQYVQNSHQREEANKVFGFRTNWRATRKKLDGYMPLLFSIVWVALLLSNPTVLLNVWSWICEQVPS